MNLIIGEGIGLLFLSTISACKIVVTINLYNINVPLKI